VNIDHQTLKNVAVQIFSAIGCDDTEAETIARLLVTANLVGHDSHGVARIPRYVDYWRKGQVLPNQHATVTFENDQIAIFDGNKLKGLITINIVAENTEKKDTKIKNVMEPKPPVLDSETPANAVSQLTRISGCVLVEKNDKIIGIITATDILKMM